MPIVDPANVQPGDHPPVPQSRDSLLIEALRHAERVSILLNDIRAALYRMDPAEASEFDAIHQLLLRQHSDCSGLHLFIAADNLGLNLPDDLKDERDYGSEA